jgi:hypothetical protein
MRNNRFNPHNAQEDYIIPTYQGQGYATMSQPNTYTPLPIDEWMNAAQAREDQYKVAIAEEDATRAVMLFDAGLGSDWIAEELERDYRPEFEKIASRLASGENRHEVQRDFRKFREKLAKDSRHQTMYKDREVRDAQRALYQKNLADGTLQTAHQIHYNPDTGRINPIPVGMDPVEFYATRAVVPWSEDKPTQSIYDKIKSDFKATSRDGNIKVDPKTGLSYITTREGEIEWLDDKNLTEKLKGYATQQNVEGSEAARQSAERKYLATGIAKSRSEAYRMYAENGDFLQDLVDNNVGKFTKQKDKEKDTIVDKPSKTSGGGGKKPDNILTPPAAILTTVNQRSLNGFSDPGDVTSSVDFFNTQRLNLFEEVKANAIQQGLFTTNEKGEQVSLVSMKKGSDGYDELYVDESKLSSEQKEIYNRMKPDLDYNNLQTRQIQIKRDHAIAYDLDMQKKAGLVDHKGNSKVSKELLNQAETAYNNSFIAEFPLFATLYTANGDPIGYSGGKFTDINTGADLRSSEINELYKNAKKNPSKVNDLLVESVEAAKKSREEFLKKNDKTGAYQKYYDLYDKAGQDLQIQANVYQFGTSTDEIRDVRELTSMIMRLAGTETIKSMMYFEGTDTPLSIDDINKISDYLLKKSQNKEEFKSGEEGLIGWRYDKNDGVVITMAVPGVGEKDKKTSTIELRGMADIEKYLGPHANRVIQYQKLHKSLESSFGQAGIVGGGSTPEIKVKQVDYDVPGFPAGHYLTTNEKGQDLRFATPAELIEYNQTREVLYEIKDLYNDPDYAKLDPIYFEQQTGFKNREELRKFFDQLNQSSRAGVSIQGK